ncbi:response regulator [Marinobacter halodurans]|uniref:Response regulator n=1 Tax=Marinobacter halodurans TaxID=2528979 RepID=A0ABY1ZF32_9GAMM|nr:response regulator [Marinobacter halodurans]TBW49236.1 response regulator [Marinobacter halodurans]
MITATRAATILIAEDDPDDRLLLSEAISDSQMTYETVFATDGEEVMSFLRGNPASVKRGALPDLILLDINMPRKNGEEVIRELAGHPFLGKIPIIVLSTASNLASRLGHFPNVHQCFSKPANYSDLVCLVSKLPTYIQNDRGRP